MKAIIIFGENPDQSITVRARQFTLVEHPRSVDACVDACNEDGEPEFHFATREEAQKWLETISQQVWVWEVIAEKATQMAREEGMRPLDVLLARDAPKPVRPVAYSRPD